MKRLAASWIMVGSLVVAGAGPAHAEGGVTVGAHSGAVQLAPEAGAIEDLLPPGARQALSVLRVVKGLSARNGVYREAGSVQRDLRAYYDAQIETARRQLLNREQLGLEPSQVRAYQRVKARLEAERESALGITEDEKRAAKYGFESALVRELTESLVRVPRIQRGLGKMKAAVEDLRGAVEQARAALDGGVPLTAVLGDIGDKLDRLDRYADLASLIDGKAGQAIASAGGRVRAVVDNLQRPIDEAIGAADGALGELDGLIDGIDEQLQAGRTVRADAAVREAAGATLERIFTPRGEGAPPEVDIVADAVARGHNRSLVQNVGVAIGELDPAEFNRMRDRVHAAMLGRSLERIGDICGRLIGAARRAQLDAAASGEPTPDTSTPCTLFGNPEALQAMIDAQNTETTTGASSTTQLAPAPPPAAVSGERNIDGTYTGTFDLEWLLAEAESTAKIEANEIGVVVVAGVVQSVTGQFGVGGPCEYGPNAGAPIALYTLFDGPAGIEPPGEENGWRVTMPLTVTVDARGSCPPPDDDEGFYLGPEDFEGSVPGEIVLDFSIDVVTFEIVSDEDDEFTLAGTMTRQ
jgi:hypothetical protein